MATIYLHLIYEAMVIVTLISIRTCYNSRKIFAQQLNIF